MNQEEIVIDATMKEVKNQLAKRLKELSGVGFYKTISERVGCNKETVRLWFITPTRRSKKIEKQAFLLVKELQKSNEKKLKLLES